jgi:hypothetical protein
MTSSNMQYVRRAMTPVIQNCSFSVRRRSSGYRLFVATLLSEALIDGGTLLDRIAALEIGNDAKERLLTWVRVTVVDIAKGE